MKTDKPANLQKGKPKGGSRFPRYGLKECASYLQKLVSKTHTSPQPRDIIASAVVNARGVTSEVKISALKQFGLIDGPSTAYEATTLARNIVAAPEGEQQNLFAQAATSPDVFKGLFETFHGDEITLAKLRQRAADLKVHPDNLQQCVALYVDSLVFAGLASANGDMIKHSDINSNSKSEVKSQSQEMSDETDDTDGETGEEELENGSPLMKGPRAVFNVNVNLDASLDTDKLERQLKLLKRFGAI